MPTYDVSVEIRDVDTGLLVFGAPLTRRVVTDESTGPMTYEQAYHASDFTAVPVTLLDNVQLLLISASEDITVRLDAQTDKGAKLKAGGFLLVVDGTINAAAATNVKVFSGNADQDTAVIKLFEAGT